MLRRIGLAIVFIVYLLTMYAQVDSLAAVPMPDSLQVAVKKVPKAEILQWIEDHNLAPGALPSRNVPLQYAAGDIYQSNWLFISRPDLPQASVWGFEQPLGAFNPGLYHGYYLSFYPRIGDLDEGYTAEIYPYEPALSYIKGGLGEYEHHFARVGFMKNKLFGIENCYYQGDLLAQNGLWTDIDAAETSHKHYFTIPVKHLQLSAEYANWNKDVSMLELLPGYWQSTNFMITHRMNHVYASLAHPLAALSLMHTEEKATAQPFSKMLVNKTTQLRLSRTRDYGTWKYLAAYEHALRDANFDATATFGQEDYQDKLSFVWDSHPYVGLHLNLQLLDWEKGRLHSEVLIPVAGAFVGAYYRMKMGKGDYRETVMNIFNSRDSLAMLNIDTRREQAVFGRYQYQGISTVLSLGSRAVKQVAGDNYLTFEKEQPFLRLGMDLNQVWGKWRLQATPRWSWYKQEDYLYESPEFSFQSVQNLYYQLPYGNKLLAGFAAYGHSGYNVASPAVPYVVEGSTTLDAWLGLEIESRFDFQVGMKNLLSTTIYGAAPVPRSLFAQIAWYYLN